MASADGGPRLAILYARVSTEEQACSGYSMAQQTETLRQYATREGYEVLEEVSDPGRSGESLERPGMDQVRELVEAGSVSVVLAQDRDRFAREPAYLYLLKKEFEEHGCRLQALNDRGDDSPEGQLTDGILDQIAKFERAKTAERTRRGKLQKSRQGKIIATMKPPYGFNYGGETRDCLVVDEPEMLVVEKIFRFAAEGLGTKAIQTRLYHEGIPSPTGKELWHRPVLKRMVLSDTYKPRSYEETAGLVSKEVAAALDPEKEYGIRWWNRSSQKVRHISEVGADGQRNYRQKVAYSPRDREEWIAVPVPAFLPCELVEEARTSMSDPRPQDRKNLTRDWELRGVMRCGCGAAMTTHTASRARGDGRRYHYYRCHVGVDYRRSSCNQKLVRAEPVEQAVWEFVSEIMKDPVRIRVGMDALIERRLTGIRGDPQREAKAWLEKLAETDQERRGYLKLAAKGRINDEELDRELAGLEETRRTAERELEALRNRHEEVEELKRDRDGLIASWSAAVPENLDGLTPEQRNELYRKLRLEVTPREEGYKVKGPFCTNEPLRSSRSRTTARRPPLPRSFSTASPPR